MTAPTQTHVLIRAPRRFAHPAWIPRQGVSAGLDSVLREFMDKSGMACASDGPAPSNKSAASKKSNKVEGVWITARDGLQVRGAAEGGASQGESPKDDEDDMIWWSWDDKFVGFSDW